MLDRTIRPAPTRDLHTATAEQITQGRTLVAHHQPRHSNVDSRAYCTYDGRAWPCAMRLAYLAGRADAGRADAALTGAADG
jgi:hypothetical protein